MNLSDLVTLSLESGRVSAEHPVQAITHAFVWVQVCGGPAAALWVLHDFLVLPDDLPLLSFEETRPKKQTLASLLPVTSLTCHCPEGCFSVAASEERKLLSKEEILIYSFLPWESSNALGREGLAALWMKETVACKERGLRLQLQSLWLQMLDKPLPIKEMTQLPIAKESKG